MKENFKVTELKTRLDKFLAGQLPGSSRARIQKDIYDGRVKVNDKVAEEPGQVVRIHDEIVYEVAEASDEGLKPTNTPIKVLYNDHGLIVIDKPAGLVVHEGAGFKGETLASALLYHFSNIAVVGEDHRPGIVHRLDKDTSGVVLVAATQEMYEYLKESFAERKVKKEYVALVVGRLEKPTGSITEPIGKSSKDFRKQTTKDPVNPKAAFTEYRLLEYLPTLSASKGGVDGYSLIMVKLHTGRTHQIRVHMASIGHPLAGDALYGGKKTQVEGLNRQFLHARKIEVRLPDDSWIEAESPLPEDLKDVLKKMNSKDYLNL